MYAFIPREAVSKFLGYCVECQQKNSAENRKTPVVRKVKKATKRRHSGSCVDNGSAHDSSDNGGFSPSSYSANGSNQGSPKRPCLETPIAANNGATNGFTAITNTNTPINNNSTNSVSPPSTPSTSLPSGHLTQAVISTMAAMTQVSI